MSDAWGYDDEQPEVNLNNGPKPLRDAYEAQRKANKELQDRLAKMEEIVNRTQVADIVESQGVARSAAQYYKGEPDPEKVTSWVNDIRSAFGVAPQPLNETPDEPVLNASDQEQYQRMIQAGANAATPGNYEVANQAILSANSTAERIAAFQNLARQQSGKA